MLKKFAIIFVAIIIIIMTIQLGRIVKNTIEDYTNKAIERHNIQLNKEKK